MSQPRPLPPNPQSLEDIASIYADSKIPSLRVYLLTGSIPHGYHEASAFLAEVFPSVEEIDEYLLQRTPDEITLARVASRNVVIQILLPFLNLILDNRFRNEHLLQIRRGYMRALGMRTSEPPQRIPRPGLGPPERIPVRPNPHPYPPRRNPRPGPSRPGYNPDDTPSRYR